MPLESRAQHARVLPLLLREGPDGKRQAVVCLGPIRFLPSPLQKGLHAPVDHLVSNWAYMVMTSLAWSLKAWIGLSIPVDGRWREKHEQERRRVDTLARLCHRDEEEMDTLIRARTSALQKASDHVALSQARIFTGSAAPCSSNSTPLIDRRI